MQLSSDTADLFSDGPVDMLIYIGSVMGLLTCKYEHFWQEVSVDSDTDC